MGKTFSLLLPALLVLAPSAPAQGGGEGDGGPIFASLDGLWEVSVTSTFFSVDGALKNKVKTRTFIEFNDLGSTTTPVTLEASSFPTGIGLAIFPRTAGLRFLDYFVIKGVDAEFAGTLKIDPRTFLARSFRATGSLLTSEGVTVVGVKGRRKGVLPRSTLSVADFETGLGPYAETDAAGAPAETLWHAEGFCAPGTPIPASMGFGAAAYNRGELGVYDYSTGAANSGALEGPEIAVPTGVRGVLLVFDTLRSVEAGSVFDQTWVDVRPAESTNWVPLSQTLNIVPCGAAPQTVTVGLGKKSLRFLGSSFAHRFRFDTIDDVNNVHAGWYVDNVEVQVVGPAQ
ncbi:MAG TPA: hypothetical protein VFI25_00690 [Planctomycetota bacterium]|nr:hypothetical protein [Planctomycetota bacterium]